MLDPNCNVWESPVADVVGVFHVSLGVLGALIIALGLVYLYVRDITQKRPYGTAQLSDHWSSALFLRGSWRVFRQYFFLGDREEMPFNRATRAWVYRMAKNEAAFLVLARLMT
jgi:hypothetical protein